MDMDTSDGETREPTSKRRRLRLEQSRQEGCMGGLQCSEPPCSAQTNLDTDGSPLPQHSSDAPEVTQSHSNANDGTIFATLTDNSLDWSTALPDTICAPLEVSKYDAHNDRPHADANHTTPSSFQNGAPGMSQIMDDEISLFPGLPIVFDQWHPDLSLKFGPDADPYKVADGADDWMNIDTVESNSGVETNEVCFGMISGIDAKCDRSRCLEFPRSFAAELKGSDRFVSKDDDLGIEGRILAHGQMLKGLLEEPSLHLVVSCSLTGDLSKRGDRQFARKPCCLSIAICGPFELFDEIGEWFQEYDIYLQDPAHAVGLDMKYCNPHRLSFKGLKSCGLVSSLLAQSSKHTGFKEVAEQPDALDILSSHTDLEETTQPQMISTTLKRHQKQALTFMLRREKGWAFDEDGRDIWVAKDGPRGLHFLNRISGSQETNEPPPFRGGVIADPMGLGKTLTMISLAASDLENPDSAWFTFQQLQNGKHKIKATLIIVPPPLLGSWEEQLSEHIGGERLPFRLHYGKTKLSHIEEVEGIRILLTTYHTVSAEWKATRSKRNSVLFSGHWKRIVLDEAHFIRNENSRMSRAVCDLEATARWAVTGTPIQNRLDDLSTLLKFIRAYPYNDPKQFKADFSAPWKSGDDEKAVTRLKYLSASLLLRRAKSTISLPPRRDLQCPVEFSPDERRAYQGIRERAITRIDEALQSGSDASKSFAYVNVLQQIESLRLTCNLGLHYHSRHTMATGTQGINEGLEWASTAQQAFDAQREMEPITCLQCASSLEITETSFDELSDARKSPRFFCCGRFCCGECTGKSDVVSCGHKPSCDDATVSIDEAAPKGVPSLQTLEPLPSLIFPSKVQALLRDIDRLSKTTKCIVFSTWRLTLDLVEAALNQASISNSRFDGSIPQKERQKIVDRFRKDPSVRVMLLTLSCGAVGLTLTAASRAYLMEPHWNPTVEEQALARIHRIGQTQAVTTVRFYIRDSFEEQVIELQTSKKQLAGVLLSPNDDEGKDDRLGVLHKLRSLL